MTEFIEVRKDKKKSQKDTVIPTRKTKNSAGYDFYVKEDTYILPSDYPLTIWTDIKVKLDEDEVLVLSLRSSIANRGLILSNGIGVIDADYYNNESNDGNIGFMITNMTDSCIVINAGERIGQGIILNYKKTEDDNTTETRKGGFGSTD